MATESEYEKLFGTKTGPGRKALTEEEKRKARIDKKRREEAAKRAVAVLKYRHSGEYDVLMETEYRALSEDPRFLINDVNRG